MWAPPRTTDPLKQLASAGIALWLDDLSRPDLRSGGLKNLIDTKHVVGITTSAANFRGALQDGNAYHRRIRELAARGATADDIVRELTTEDVRDATDLFSAVYCHTRGLDGRVSIGGDPRLAYDTASTIEQAEIFPGSSTVMTLT
jgi:transaldolase